MGPCNGACCSSRRSEPFAGQCHYNMPMRSFWWLRRKVIAFQNTPNAPGPRILFALSSRKRESGYGLVQQVIDPQDGRRTQTFLTAKGNALVHEIVRLVRSDRQRGMKLRKFDDNGEATTKFGTRSVALPLIAAGLKLGADDIQLVIRQVETLIGHRQSNRSPRPHDASTNRRRYR
jgi:DNA-binding MarR family transcriptional regulator